MARILSAGRNRRRVQRRFGNPAHGRLDSWLLTNDNKSVGRERRAQLAVRRSLFGPSRQHWNCPKYLAYLPLGQLVTRKSLAQEIRLLTPASDFPSLILPSRLQWSLGFLPVVAACEAHLPQRIALPRAYRCCDYPVWVLAPFRSSDRHRADATMKPRLGASFRSKDPRWPPRAPRHRATGAADAEHPRAAAWPGTPLGTKGPKDRGSNAARPSSPVCFAGFPYPHRHHAPEADP